MAQCTSAEDSVVFHGDSSQRWQERRRIEETYAANLRKLAGKQFEGTEAADLGIFSTPWQKMTASTETLAKAHHNLAQNIGVDVEMPLREWTTKDREMQAMGTIVGNIQAIAKELENAQKKADKLTGKGGKADTGKVAAAATGVENALSQWESQAPYVFERLQAVDEARTDKLRDVLTQYQTHIIEAGSSLSGSAEDSLNSLLNVQTPDEIKTFALKSTKVLPNSQRRMSMRPDPAQSSRPDLATSNLTPAPTGDAGSSLTPIPSITRPDDESSFRSSSCKNLRLHTFTITDNS